MLVHCCLIRYHKTRVTHTRGSWHFIYFYKFVLFLICVYIISGLFVFRCIYIVSSWCFINDELIKINNGYQINLSLQSAQYLEWRDEHDDNFKQSFWAWYSVIIFLKIWMTAAPLWKMFIVRNCNDLSFSTLQLWGGHVMSFI